MDERLEWELREEAFTHLRLVQLRTGGPVTRTDVSDFEFRGERMSLMPTQQGIWKPRQLSAALAIRTVFEDDPAKRPYEDEPGDDGFLRYKWRGFDPNHFENRALRLAMRARLPLIWYWGVASGVYHPVFPVWLIDEEPASHQFVVSVESASSNSDEMDYRAVDRQYIDTIRRQRVHQPVFRERVLQAYQSRCAMCRLRHRPLLEAAHIVRDSDGGEAAVTNGISLCRLHHGAYDSNIIGIRPDYKLDVAPKIRTEVDGPTLEHSIKALHGETLVLPSARKARPDPDHLAQRFEEFAAVTSGS